MFSDAKDWLAPRRCLRDPIPQIFEAARDLSQAVDAHLSGRTDQAEGLIKKADCSTIREWVAPLLGSPIHYPSRADFVRLRSVADAPPKLRKAERVSVRMPNQPEQAAILEQQGRHCRFCGIPLIGTAVRKALIRHYPKTVRWGGTFDDCHAALLCMWLQFDHVLPHSRGGSNEPSNILVTCSGCNYGRMSATLDEVGIIDPRGEEPIPSNWDGLERLLAA